MRALIIGHAYVAKDNCAKWEVLARRGEAEIEIHLPHRWPSWETEYRPTETGNEVQSSEFGVRGSVGAKAEGRSGNLRIRVAHAIRVGREDQYFFAPQLFRGLTHGHFDVLHVEQGAAAFVYSQALLERNLFARKTKTCFFTWINWESPMRWPWKMAERYNLKHSDGAIGGNCEAVDILKRHGFRGKTAVIPQLGFGFGSWNSKMISMRLVSGGSFARIGSRLPLMMRCSPQWAPSAGARSKRLKSPIGT